MLLDTALTHVLHNIVTVFEENKFSVFIFGTVSFSKIRKKKEKGIQICRKFVSRRSRVFPDYVL